MVLRSQSRGFRWFYQLKPTASKVRRGAQEWVVHAWPVVIQAGICGVNTRNEMKWLEGVMTWSNRYWRYCFNISSDKQILDNVITTLTILAGCVVRNSCDCFHDGCLDVLPANRLRNPWSFLNVFHGKFWQCNSLNFALHRCLLGPRKYGTCCQASATNSDLVSTKREKGGTWPMQQGAIGNVRQCSAMAGFFIRDSWLSTSHVHSCTGMWDDSTSQWVETVLHFMFISWKKRTVPTLNIF